MVAPQTVLESLATALHESGRLPDETTYATLELDADGAQSDVEPPIVELTLANLACILDRNTELVGYETDANGNHIGRIYRENFELQAQLDCLTADGSQYDAREMGQQLRAALAQYDSAKLADPLPDPETGTPLSAVWHVSAEGSSRPNDLSMTPALRRTQTEVVCRFSEEYASTDYHGPEDYIRDHTITPTVL